MDDNPYKSPADYPTERKPPSQKLAYAYDLLVSVHHWTGVNLLGVLLLCLWFVPIAILGERDLLSAWATRIALLGLAIVCAAIDVFVPYSHPSSKGRMRYLSPFAGGTFLYFPIWLLISGLWITAAVSALVSKISGSP